METLFLEVSLLILIATGMALVLRALKQPLILAYLLAGVIAGPWGLNLITAPQLLGVLSSFGIALLLFMVGLELDLKRLRSWGKRAMWVGLGQIIITAFFGFIINRLFGLTTIASLYIALALTFSSTIIIVKLLSDKGELDSLSGRITVTILLLQDALAIISLIAVSSIGGASDFPTLALLVALSKGILLAAGTFVVGKFIMPRLFNFIAHSAELLFITSLSWCLLITITAAWSGISLEIGAFLAGLALASLPYNLEINAKLKSLKDFFILLFFIGLGSQLTLTGFGQFESLFWVLVFYVVIGNPLILLILMGLFGYHKRTSFLVALSAGMVSEFSFVLMSLGLRLGQVTPAQVSLVTAVGGITITITAYLISHAESIYKKLSPLLNILGRSEAGEEQINLPTKLNRHVILVGYDRLGERIGYTLEKLHKDSLIIDLNPDVIKKLIAQGRNCIYGDLSDMEILQQAGIDRACMLISTVPDINDNLRLIKDVRKKGLKLPLYLTANTWHGCRDLYAAGADYVIFPHYLSAEHFSLLLNELAFNPDRVQVDKEKHLSALVHHYANKHKN